MEERAEYTTSGTRRATVPEFATVYHNDPNYGDNFAMLYDWTWEVPLSSVAHTAYCYLLHRCGAQKKWAVKREEIAAACHISDRRLPPYIQELIDNGFITVENHQAQGQPSAYRICTKAQVAATQSLMQRDLGTKRPQETNRPQGKTKRPQGATKRPHIKVIDTDIDTDIDTRNGASAPPAAAEPPAAPLSKPRKPSLKDAEPAVHERREAIKAHYLSVTEQDWAALTVTRQKWINRDCEALARKSEQPADALAAIDAVQSYWFTDKDGQVVYPYRTPLKLSRVVELWANIQRGELVPRSRRCGPRRFNEGTSAQVAASMASFQECGACGWEAGWNPACAPCLAIAKADGRDL